MEISISNALNIMKLLLDISWFAGITLAQNFRATSRLRPGDFERCFIKQGDTRLHVAAVLTC